VAFMFEVTKCIAVLLDGIFNQLRNYNCNHYRTYLLEGGAKMTFIFFQNKIVFYFD